MVNDGEDELEEVLAEVPEGELNHVRLSPDKNYILGKLRNIALEAATGDFLVQWDDDEWYHPERIEKQARRLMEGFDACTLQGTLMHVNDREFKYYPYIGYLSDGIPGSIMHRREESIRYPELSKAEDSYYLGKWKEKNYTLLSKDYNYLFIRCFHGDNTWDRHHFMTRMRNTPSDALKYLWYRHIKGDLSQHPRFKLSDAAKETFNMYLEDSKKLELI